MSADADRLQSKTHTGGTAKARRTARVRDFQAELRVHDELLPWPAPVETELERRRARCRQPALEALPPAVAEDLKACWELATGDYDWATALTIWPDRSRKCKADRSIATPTALKNFVKSSHRSQRRKAHGLKIYL